MLASSLGDDGLRLTVPAAKCCFSWIASVGKGNEYSRAIIFSRHTCDGLSAKSPSSRRRRHHLAKAKGQVVGLQDVDGNDDGRRTEVDVVVAAMPKLSSGGW